MSWGSYPWGTKTWGGDGAPQFTPDPFRQAQTDLRSLLIFAVVTTPSNPSGPDEVFRVASKYYVTKPSDTPANDVLEPRALSPYAFESQIGFPTDPNAARGSGSLGRVVILNEDGIYNSWLNRGWEGKKIYILAGGTVFPGLAGEFDLAFDEWGLISFGIVEGVIATTGRIDLVIRDFLAQLRTPYQTDVYDGDFASNPETIEGDDTIKGKTKPWTGGAGKNVPITIVNPGLLIGQWSNRGSQAVKQARDNGVPLTPGGNVSLATITDSSYTLPAGADYVTHIAKSLIRYNDALAGAPTADVEGDNEGGYVDTIAGMIRRVATTQGGPLDEVELDGGAFQSFPFDGEIGYHLRTGETKSVEEIILELLGPGERKLGWMAPSRQGLLRIGTWPDPAGAPVARFTAVDVQEIDEGGAPHPVFRYRPSYRRNWTRQDPDSLGAIGEEKKALYASDYSSAPPEEDLSVQADNRLAQDVELLTLFNSESDATAAAQSFLARDKVRRRGFRVLIRPTTFLRNLGDVIEVDIEQLGLSGGQRGVICGFREVGSARTFEARLWA